VRGRADAAAHYVCEQMFESDMLVAMDMVEVNPALADEAGVQRTGKLAIELVASALGRSILK
jgi:arginase